MAWSRDSFCLRITTILADRYFLSFFGTGSLLTHCPFTISMACSRLSCFLGFQNFSAYRALDSFCETRVLASWLYCRNYFFRMTRSWNNTSFCLNSSTERTPHFGAITIFRTGRFFSSLHFYCMDSIISKPSKESKVLHIKLCIWQHIHTKF